MESELGGFIFLCIPTSHIVQSKRLFKQHYTVDVRQEYEIVFSRVNHTATQTVNRRYRQFRQLYVLASNYHLHLPDFPKKRWTHKLSYHEVERRRQMLERWIHAAITQPLLQPSLHTFLDITYSPLLNEEWCTAGDLVVSAFLTRLHSQAHMKIAALKEFDLKFFGHKDSAHPDRLLVLLEHLAELSVDEHTGSLSLHIFVKLLSRDKCKAAPNVLEQLQNIRLSCLKGMQLETYIGENAVHDVCYSVFHLLQTFETEYAHLGPHYLLEILNLDFQALKIYQQWRERNSLQEPEEEMQSRWKCANCEGCPELNIKYRLNCKDLEVRVSLSINASAEQVIEALTQPGKRKLWDFSLADMNLLARTQEESKYQFAIDVNCVRESWESHCTVKYDMKHHALVVFSGAYCCASFNITQIKQVTHSTAEIDSDEYTPTFYLTDGEQVEGAHCSLTCEERLSKGLAKLYLTDIAGEAEMLSMTWMKFKSVAEGDLSPTILNSYSEDLKKAVERKSLGTSRSFTRENREFRQYEDVSRDRLARRMFA